MKTEKIKLEIRAAEGGEDSKLLVGEMVDIYKKAASLNNFKVEVDHWLPGYASLWLSGDGVKKFFEKESGHHRWQRIPPTEKRGRVQTSTVTVAIIENTEIKFQLNRNEVHRKYTRGSGNGGQNRNKVETVCVLTHIPTGIIVRCEEHRTRDKNEETAWLRLEEKLKSIYITSLDKKQRDIRFNQIGYGNRSDKKRTYRIQDGVVIDHISGKQISVRDLYKGKLDLLQC